MFVLAPMLQLVQMLRLVHLHKNYNFYLVNYVHMKDSYR
jgi:hypothetical protein